MTFTCELTNDTGNVIARWDIEAPDFRRALSMVNAPQRADVFAIHLRKKTDVQEKSSTGVN